MRDSQQVVVGIDGSKDGLVALAWAAEYAARHGGRLRAVHVLDDLTPAEHLAPAMAQLLPTGDGTDILEEAATELARLGRDGVPATFEIRHGHPGRMLLELARPAAMLVVGRLGMEGFAELVLGSTSQLCAALATGPAVVVPDSWQPDAPRAGRIVVGIDGSGTSRPALRFAFDAASRGGATLVAVHAVRMPEFYPRADVWLDPQQPPWSTQLELLVAETLAGWAETYPDVAVERRISAGHPVQVLAAESANADLVVVDGAARERFTPLRLGSVSRGLLHHAACPVAVVHEDGAS
jgi:nucleotide-binding universal stress UspA family protein